MAMAESESRDMIVQQGGVEALLQHLQSPLSPPQESQTQTLQPSQEEAISPGLSSPWDTSVAPGREPQGMYTREASSAERGDHSKPWRDIELETEVARALYVLAVSRRSSLEC